MRVVLISTYDKIEATGLRILSACLKQAGFDTNMVFLPSIDRLMSMAAYGSRNIPAKALQQIVDLCEGAGLVGLSVMTASFHEARQVTDAIHEALRVPVIWGGAHPTVRPAECLQFADMVCRGEGERTIIELAQGLREGRDCSQINNLALLGPGGGLVVNPVFPLEQNLDALPFPDYDFAGQFILHDGRIEPCCLGLVNFYLCQLASWADGPVYSVVTSRGCPHRCAYCINHVLARIYAGWGTMRRRSPEGIVAEIRAVRARLPDIEAIDLRDEMFLASPRSYIATFSQRYREGVGLPFRANTSPATADVSKLRRLVEAGLQEIIMGIQSGAPHILKLYDRPFSNEQVIRAAESIHSLLCWTSPPRYDLITDNPYETDADRFETLRLVHRLPRPFKLSLYSLTLLPGTRLHERAVSDGLVDGEDRTSYQHSFSTVRANCCNLLLMCHNWNLPGPLLRLVTHRVVFSLLSFPVFDRVCGWILTLLLACRLRRNREVLARRRLRWLDRLEREAA